MKRRDLLTFVLGAVILACFWLTAGCAVTSRMVPAASPATADSDGQFISRVRSLKDAEQVIRAIASPIRIAYSVTDITCASVVAGPVCEKAEELRPRLRTLEASAYAVLDTWRRIGEDDEGARAQAVIALLRLWRDFMAVQASANGFL